MTIKSHPNHLQALEQRVAALAGIVESAQDAGELRRDQSNVILLWYELQP